MGVCAGTATVNAITNAITFVGAPAFTGTTQLTYRVSTPVALCSNAVVVVQAARARWRWRTRRRWPRTAGP
jgi:hypothetical protein